MSTCAHAGCVHARLVCLACASATSVAPPSPIAASHMNARARRQPHARPLAHRSSPIPACHCLCATAVPPPALACSAAHAAMLGEPANREMADVSMVCSRSGSQRAMMISRGAAMRMHEWRITQGLRSHVSCVHEVTHLRRELVLGRRVVLGDVRLHVPTDRPTDRNGRWMTTSYSCSRSVGRSVRHTSKVTYITQLCQNNALSLKQHTHGRACGRLKQVPTTPPMHPLQHPTTRDDHESPGEAREAKHRKDLKMHDFTLTHLKLVLGHPTLKNRFRCCSGDM